MNGVRQRQGPVSQINFPCLVFYKYKFEKLERDYNFGKLIIFPSSIFSYAKMRRRNFASTQLLLPNMDQVGTSKF